MRSMTGLLRSTDKRLQGPSPSFYGAHVLLAFLTIGSNGPIGRQALALHSGLGEGAVRTVLKRLREEGYVDVNASGCYLTRPGLRVYNEFGRKLTETVTMADSPLIMGGFQVSIVIRGGGKSVKSGIEQRDSAVRIGADGATTYVIKADRFTIHGGSSDCEKDFPSKAWSTLRAELKPRNGDAVIVCGASLETAARLGALSAALTLL